jgi:hypothetical protein
MSPAGAASTFDEGAIFNTMRKKHTEYESGSCSRIFLPQAPVRCSSTKLRLIAGGRWRRTSVRRLGGICVLQH